MTPRASVAESHHATVENGKAALAIRIRKPIGAATLAAVTGDPLPVTNWPVETGQPRPEFRGDLQVRRAVVGTFHRAVHGKLSTGVFQSATNSPCYRLPGTRDLLTRPDPGPRKLCDLSFVLVFRSSGRR
jgi:hypothetical protein